MNKKGKEIGEAVERAKKDGSLFRERKNFRTQKISLLVI